MQHWGQQRGGSLVSGSEGVDLLRSADRRYHHLRIAFKLLSQCHGKRILDVGCGQGLLERYFSNHECIGMDVSLSALRHAKRNAERGKYMLADMTSLPVKERCVDIVAMIAVLGGVPQGKDEMVFGEAGRVLTDGGHVVILVSQKRLPYSLLVPDRVSTGWKWRHFNAKALQKQLNASGFLLKETVFVGGIISLSIDIFECFWGLFWRCFSRKILRRYTVPRLPHGFLNIIESREFQPFSQKSSTFARFFYMVAQKSHRSQ